MPPAITRAEIESIVQAATLAPSVLNIQPWRFVARRDGVVELHRDLGRMLPALDPRHRALTISCGAALFNLRLAAAATRRLPEVQLLPGGSDASLLATVRVVEHTELSAEEARLQDAITRRRTSRVPFDDQRLPPEIISSLVEAASRERATLRLLDPTETAEVARLVHQADRAQRDDPQVRDEVARWTRRGVDSPDGIPEESLGPVAEDPAALVRDFAMGEPVRSRPAARFEPNPTLAVLLTDDDHPDAWLRAGQALERVWLRATAAGAAVSLLTQPLELSNIRWLVRPLTGGALVPGDHVRKAVGSASSESWPQVIMRLGNALSPTGPTPRRPVADVLTFADW